MDEGDKGGGDGVDSGRRSELHDNPFIKMIEVARYQGIKVSDEYLRSKYAINQLCRLQFSTVYVDVKTV